MTNIINSSPYLRTSREFPQNIEKLTLQIDKSWVDIANTMNVRTIGLFPTNRQAISGESWFLTGNQRQQTLRQVYIFNGTSAITHNISVTDPNQFTRCWGSYTDGTNNYGIIWGTSVAIAGQISFYVTATQILFKVGAGAPSLVSGRIVLEWLSSS